MSTASRVSSGLVGESVVKVSNDSAILLFAQTLCKINPLPQDKVHTLLQFCPTSKYQDDYTKVQQRKWLSQLVNVRSRHCIEGLGYIVVNSNSDGFIDSILAVLCGYLKVLPHAVNHIDQSKHFQNDIAAFVACTIAQLGRIAEKLEVRRPMIASLILDFFKEVNSLQSDSLIDGALMGMAEPIPFQQSDITEILSLLDNVTQVGRRAKVMLVMNRLCTHEKLLTKAEYEKFFNTAQESIQRRDLSPEVARDIYQAAIKMTISCGLHNDQFTERVISFLKGYFNEYFDTLRTNNNFFTEDVMENYRVSLKGLTELATVYPNKASSIVEFLSSVLLSSASQMNSPQNIMFRDETTKALSQILKQQMQREQGDLRLVNPVFTALYTPFYVTHTEYLKYLEEGGDSSFGRQTLRMTERGRNNLSKEEEKKAAKLAQNELLLSNLIVIIGRITAYLDNPKVTDLILQRLLQRIHYPPQAVDQRIIEQLSELCVLGQENAYNEIIVEFMNIFKRILKDTQSTNISNTVMPNAFLYLAQNVTHKAIRENLLRRILRLFQQLGKDIITPEDRALSSPLIQGMGYLLPIIAELLREYDNTAILEIHSDPESDMNKLFRSVWFYCVLFQFVEREKWRSDWYECTRKIGHKMPVPITLTPTYYAQMELEIEALIQNGFTDKEMHHYQKLLDNYLPNHSKSLNNAQRIYVLSIYYLETLRAQSGTFLPILVYLEDPGILSRHELVDCMRGIADKTFPIFIESMRIFNIATPERLEGKLEAETQALMLKFCSSSISARKVAAKFVLSLAELFPQITWNKKCITTLLDLLETVGKATKLTMAGSVRLPNSSFEVQMPDGKTERQVLLKEMAELSTTYLKYGISTAKNTTHSTIQEYMKSFRELSLGYLHHIGFSLAVEINANTDGEPTNAIASRVGTLTRKEKYYTVPLPDCVYSSSSTFVNTLELKATYTGEIEGMTEFLEGLEDKENMKQKAAIKMSQILLNKFKNIIQAAKEHQEVNMKELNHTIYRSVAFIISQKQVIQQDLIHMVCWVPVLLFTEDTLRTGVGAWTWLLVARPDLSMLVMNEMRSAWEWTIDERIGLFTNAERKSSPLSVSKEDVKKQRKASHHFADPNPHKIWIDFLSERFVVSLHGHREHFNVLLKMMLKAVHDCHMFSSLPNSVCIRFKLLLLCLRMLQSVAQFNFKSDPLTESVLRENVYKAALSWFCYSPTWYDVDDHDIVAADIQTMIEFCKTINREEEYDNATRDFVPLGSSTSAMANATSGTEEIYLTRNLKQTRKLITLLIGNEIDRIAAWTNPQHRLVYIVPEEQKFSSAKVSSWRDFVTVAWIISPAIAVHMSARFPNSNKIKAVLAKMIRENVRLVYNIPEAFPFLVNENTVRDDIPELRSLVYWTNVSPPMALSLLRKEYNSHPLVTQYAVRVLGSFPPDTIIYYIPQLIQALRYDRTDLVQKYLVNAAKTSESLAHNLIWNTQTYNYNELEGGDLGKKAKTLRESIIANFSETEKANYLDEFGFFDDITNLSAIIMAEAPTKEDRKPLLIQLLQKFRKPTSNLYLPTNPDIKTHGIIPTSSTSLQSAAKAPILVSFECHLRDDEREEMIDDIIEVVKEKEDPEKNGEVSVTKILGRKKVVRWDNIFKQACIFKVGDDVRQDMLAVQIIDLFKKTFQSVGLDLFLYPYKVIATKPGCGMIEVVPNSSSRDQLGKKVEGGLVEYFAFKYGHPTSAAYQEARLNFIKSMAAYAVVCFILQVKDRHNGNILIDEDGHVVHIDFGFIFDSSPGGNIGFEVAPFKLSAEMIAIMGSRPDAEPFKYFMEMAVKAFLAVRQYSDSIVTLVSLMLDTALPGFRPETIDRLVQRLAPEKTERQAAQHMTEQCVKAFSSFASVTTYFYDLFQAVTQGIDY